MAPHCPMWNPYMCERIDRFEFRNFFEISGRFSLACKEGVI